MTQPNNPDGPDLNLYRTGRVLTPEQVDALKASLANASNSLSTAGENMRNALAPIGNLFSNYQQEREAAAVEWRELDDDDDDDGTNPGFPVAPTEMI